jgi:hypothetical protein
MLHRRLKPAEEREHCHIPVPLHVSRLDIHDLLFDRALQDPLLPARIQASIEMKEDIFTPVIRWLKGLSDRGVSQNRVSGVYSAGRCAVKSSHEIERSFSWSTIHTGR